jgi:AraC-like DNA-binding protein
MQDVIPNPCVNMIIERSKSAIYGASKNKYSHLLQGKGTVFGVKFKPGGFYPFIQQAVSGLTNNPMTVQDVFDVEAHTMENAILSQEEETRMVELAEGLIRPKLPERDELVTLINTMIDRIIEDREITRVDQVAQCFNINKRKLQRIFDQYVGVSPKWVIQLYRLHNAAEAMDNQQNHDGLKLSMELGYHDQSHFIKDFKAAIGKTPDEYANHKE